MPDAESELRVGPLDSLLSSDPLLLITHQRRRDRGKVAQRAFRQRQSAVVQKLKEEHEKLKSLVGEIVQSAGGDDAAQLRAAIIQAGNAAGLDLSILDAGDKENDSSYSRTSEGLSATLHPSMAELSTGNTLYADTTLALPSSFRVEGEPVGGYDEQTTQILHATAVYNSYGQSGHMSPRLDYGLWPDQDRCPKVVLPPDDIVPFLGAGMHTFAGNIAWACLEYAYSFLREAIWKHRTAGRHSLPPGLAARTFLIQSLRPSKQLHVVAYITARIQARLEFRKLGYIRGDNPAVNMEYDQMITRRILQSFLDNGVEIDQWWSVSDVERYTIEKMGVARFVLFQAALGRGEAPYIEALRPLTRALAQSFVCAGEGARWRADHIMMVVDAWTDTVR
jgi:hypothetical protein